MKVDNNITEDEAALYDRQIRLWGVDAQKKLLNSRVLLVNVNGLGAEIAKNLVLSGIYSLTILDSSDVTEDDLKTNFLIDRTCLGQNRAKSCIDNLQILNPMVKIQAVNETVESKPDEYFYGNFDLVCILFYDNNEQLLRLNTICRQNNVKFLFGHVFGINGFMFVDLSHYNYICTVPKVSTNDDEQDKTTDKKSVDEKLELQEREKKYVSYSQFLDSYMNLIKGLTEKKLKRISKTYFLVILLRMFYDKYNRPLTLQDKEAFIDLRNDLFQKYRISSTILDDLAYEEIIGESSAVNAIIGGVMAQEVIKILSKKNEPIDNLFLFDGDAMSGVVESIGYPQLVTS